MLPREERDAIIGSNVDISIIRSHLKSSDMLQLNIKQGFEMDHFVNDMAGIKEQWNSIKSTLWKFEYFHIDFHFQIPGLD